MCFIFFKKLKNFFKLLVKYGLDMILTAFTRFSWTGLGSAAHFSLQFCLHSRCQSDSRNGPRKRGFLFLHWIKQWDLFSGWCLYLTNCIKGLERRTVKKKNYFFLFTLSQKLLLISPSETSNIYSIIYSKIMKGHFLHAHIQYIDR